MNMGQEINVEQEWIQLKRRLSDDQSTEGVLEEYRLHFSVPSLVFCLCSFALSITLR
jgi:hypothetical protein